MGYVLVDRRNRSNLGRRAAAAAAALLLLSSAPEIEAQTRIGIEIGAEPAPVVLETLDGERVDLAASFGHRPVLLQFWATWCTKCEALGPQMAAAHREFGDRVDFYGIAVAVGQRPSRIRRHLEDHPFPFTMLYDENGVATRTFMAPTTSYIVILDAEGRVAYTGIDVEQDVIGALASIVPPAAQSVSTPPS